MQLRRQVSKAGTIGAAALMLTGVFVSPSHADDAVPVLGQSLSRSTLGSAAPEAVITVHGVRRIDQGTVVYFSAGFPAGAADPSRLNLALAFVDQFRKYAVNGRLNMKDDLSSVAVIDQSGRKIYAAVSTPDKRCVCSQGSVTEHVDAKDGTAYAMYAVVPALPAGVSTVDVSVGDRVMPGIAVQDGALTPLADGNPDVLPVGAGWPTVDTAALATVTDAAASIYPLTQQVADLSGQLTTRTRPTTKSVDISSDVLFAVDSATLSTKAAATLRAAAAALKAAGATGRVDVLGYTDSTNTQAYNLALSRRRAAAVLAALKPLVPASVNLVAQGRGEADPVASNDTAAGKAANRRVALSFTQAAGR